MTSVTIPSSVTKIDMHAFKGCIGLTSISMPEVTTIDMHAFEDCVNLATVSMPKVTEIQEYAFKGCSSITAIQLPASLTSLYPSAFMDCSALASFTVDTGNTSFSAEDGVLYSYSKNRIEVYPAGKTDTSYTLPSTVEYIDSYAFYKCKYIESFDEGSNTYYCTYNDVLYRILEPNVQLIVYPAGNTQQTFDIPSNIPKTGGTRNVSSVADCAFSGAVNLTSVTVGDKVIGIGIYAFSGCTGLTDFTIPTTVASPGYNCEYIFQGCTNLVSATIGSYRIGEGMFSGCVSLKTLTISDSVKAIGSSILSPGTILTDCIALETLTVSSSNTEYSSADNVLFSKDGTILYGCAAAKTGAYEVPEGVTTIKTQAFWGCTGITSIKLSSTVNDIENCVFEGCSSLTEFTVANSNTTFSATDGVLFKTNSTLLEAYPAGKIGTSYTVPDTVTSIISYAFSGCSQLTSITLPANLEEICDSAFYGCTGLTSIVIPDNVIEINDDAFYGCIGITSVTIPSNVAEIGHMAFGGCTSLTSVTFLSTTPVFNHGTPYAAGSEDLWLMVPTGTLDTYKSAWTEYITNLHVAITAAMISEIAAQIYSGTAIEPAVTVMDGTVTLVKGTDYTVVYSDNVNAGTAKVTVTGKGTYGGSAFKTFTIAPKAVVVKANDVSKSQGSRDPALTATVTGLIGSDTVNYTLARESGEEQGTYTITASGAASQGNYTVTYENGTFTITEPAPVTQCDWTFWVWIIPAVLFIIHILMLTYREMKKE